MSQPDGCPPPGCPAVLIEAFTDRAGAGNGAAVVLLAQPADDGWMQTIAASLRQSETAFLLPHGSGWLLRWFTPTCEVPLCGHATLASLLALRHWSLLAAGQTTRFKTRSGPLEARLAAAVPDQGQISLPAGGLHQAPIPADLQAVLRLRLDSLAAAFWTSDLGYAVALLPAAAPLAAMPCIAADLPPPLRAGLVLMQPLEGEERPRLGSEVADYQLRFFAPGLGINEDPVTGSAHALVAPWRNAQLGRPRVLGWQCSYRPGGMVCEGGSSAMIRLTGSGYLLWDGTLRTSPQLACVAPGAWSSIVPAP
jgi:PhzF family phenazine biosynthesis protein